MTDLEHFFDKSPPPVHPRVRFWEGALKSGEVAHLLVEVWRERFDILSWGPTTLCVYCKDASERDVHPPEEIAWNEKLNRELIRLRARAISLENESERFGLVLRDRLDSVVIRFGDGFFSGVLIDYLGEGGFASLDPVQKALSRIHVFKPAGGPHRTRCIEFIQEELKYCVDALFEVFMYSKAQSISILSNALYSYLDERFSITTREMLGDLGRVQVPGGTI